MAVCVYKPNMRLSYHKLILGQAVAYTVTLFVKTERTFNMNRWQSFFVMQRLYSLGARKFVLMAINPNGCSPVATASAPANTGCVQILNRASHMFNANLKNLVDEIRPRMPGSNLVFVNSYKVIRDIIRFPSIRGNICMSMNLVIRMNIWSFSIYMKNSKNFNFLVLFRFSRCK